MTSPSKIFGRLYELKQWQDDQEKRKKNPSGGFDPGSLKISDILDADQIGSKQFEKLLEDKLEEFSDANRPIVAKPKRPFLKKGTGLSRFKIKPEDYKPSKTKSGNESSTDKKVEFTPLKPPEYSIKPKGRWTNNEPEPSESDPFNCDSLKRQIVEHINKLANFNETNEVFRGPERNLNNDEAELMVFEALEKRAERGSFCATSTSVLRLLDSTPSRVCRIIAGDAKINGGDSSVNKIESDNFFTALEEPQPEVAPEPIEGRWEEPSPRYSSDSSADESIVEKPLRQPSRSPTPRRGRPSPPPTCRDCGSSIEHKIRECEAELESLRSEKDRIAAIRKQIAKEKRDFEKEMRIRRRRFEEHQAKFRAELDEERRQISKERTALERQNREIKSSRSLPQRRREAEEISTLRQELDETKELLKLRDTKNALQVARLRTHIKQLETKNEVLARDVERLTKEKARLEARQKSGQRSSEVKMLHEISKNISKLTEETFRNQKFKPESNSEEEVSKRLKPGRPSGSSSGKIEKFINEDANIETLYAKLFNQDSEQSNQTIPKASRTEKTHEDGTEEVKYPNGNVKLIMTDGTIRYYHSANDTWHTNYPDGTETIEFANGQSEKRFQDGKCIVFFPDGLVQTIHPEGEEEIKYPDGSKVTIKKDGERRLDLANGQVEIHTKDQKRREYPDGTVKILYPDGSQETRYSNGRIRMKNPSGEIVLDTEPINSR